MSFGFEAAVESFHLRVVFGSPQGIRQSQAIFQKQLGCPPIASEDRISVVMHDYSPAWDVQLPEGVLGAFPSLQGQARVGAVANGPAKGQLAGEANDRDQNGLAVAIGVHQLGEVSVEHLNWGKSPCLKAGALVWCWYTQLCHKSRLGVNC